MTAPIERLRDICRQDPVGEKILLVPTYTVGQRITDTLAREGGAWIGIRSITVDGLALEIAGDRLARENRVLLSRAQALAMIESACEDVLSAGDYFGSLKHSSGFFRAIRRSIDELRASGVTAADFPTGAFSNRRKATEIRRILSRYEELIERNRFVDKAELYRLAAGSPGDSPRLDAIFSAGILDLSPVQKAFLDGVAREHVALQLPVEDVVLHAERHHIVPARGTENEIRAVVRLASKKRLSLDSIEIAHTNEDLYVPLILELSSELGLATTFEEGIPVPYTRPGQAILGYLEWLRLEWDATVLRKLLSSGVIRTGEIGPVLAARLFRNATVGWGRKRHLDRMNALVSEYARRLEGSKGNERAERGLQQVRVVRKLVRGLVRHTPPDADRVSVSDLAGHATAFLEHFARVASANDGAASEALLRVLDEVRTLPDRVEPLPGAAVRLEELVRDVSVSSAAPRPGALHVSSIGTAGWGGREHLFIVGLDERFPGGRLQDPVLLDEERMVVNRKRRGAELSLSGARSENAMRDMRMLLDRSRTTSTTFLFSSEDLLDARETIPSPFLLQLWRGIHNRPEATYDEMLRALEEGRESFVARSPVSLSEEWVRRIQRISDTRGLSPAERRAVLRSMSRSWPWLGRGLRAAEARAGREISEWSGKIDAAPGDLDPRLTGKAVSASRLEHLAQSPFRYFLQYVLGIEPLQELERKPEEWLEAREFGGLFHEVLYRFMRDLAAREELPGDSHAAELRRIALERLDSIAGEIPPPSEAAFEVRRKELLEACELFLSEERKWCRSATPRWFEVPFGMQADEDNGIGSEQGVEIDLGSSGTLLVRGRIDRIDECGEKAFAVWDYKSGSSFRYSDQEYMARGTQLQHAIYALAARELLARKKIEGDVIESGYYFPTRKGRALRIRRKPPFAGSEKARFETVLTGLLDTVRSGSFIHAIDGDACTFCDYVSICGGDSKATAKRAEKMSETSEDPGVAAFLRAREIE